MKHYKEKPIKSLVLFDRSPDQRRAMITMYQLVPTEICNIEYNRDTRMWLSDTGIEFRHSKNILKYYDEQIAQRGMPLANGTYAVDVRSVDVTSDKIVLRTDDGKEIVINLKKRASDTAA